MCSRQVGSHMDWPCSLWDSFCPKAAIKMRESRMEARILCDSQSSIFTGWLHTISLLVLALGFGSALGDPGRLYWSSGPVLAVSLLFGAIALWQRRPMHVYASGLLINVVGSLIWLAGEGHASENLA